jgi:hypothetical protein
MNARKLQLKLFADAPADLSLEGFAPVFHRWIRQRTIDELFVDVASYVHVPDGPGIALIGHESDYFVDLEDGRFGLLHSRKRDAGGTPSASVKAVFRRAVGVAVTLEGEAPLRNLRFRTDDWLFRINDRLRGPNEPATFDQVAPLLQEVCLEVFGGARHELQPVGSSRELFSVRIRTDFHGDMATVLARLAV